MLNTSSGSTSLLFLLLLTFLSAHTTTAAAHLLRRQSSTRLQSRRFEPTSSIDRQDEIDTSIEEQEAKQFETEAGEVDEESKGSVGEEVTAPEPEPTSSNDAFASLDKESPMLEDGSIPEPEQFPIAAPQPQDATGGVASVFGSKLGLASTGGEMGGNSATGTFSTGTTGTTGSTGSTGSTGNADTGTTGTTGTTGPQGLDLNEMEEEVQEDKILQENIKALMSGSPRVQAAYAKFQKAAERARQVLDTLKGAADLADLAMATASSVTGPAETFETGSTGTSGSTGNTGATGTTAALADTTSLLEMLTFGATGDDNSGTDMMTGGTGGTGGAGGTGSAATPALPTGDEVEACTAAIAPTLAGIHKRIAKDTEASEAVMERVSSLPQNFEDVMTLVQDAQDAESTEANDALVVCHDKCPAPPPGKKQGLMEKFLAKIAKLQAQCGPQLKSETSGFMTDLKDMVNSIDVTLAGDGKNSSILNDIEQRRQNETIQQMEDAKYAAEKRKAMLEE